MQFDFDTNYPHLDIQILGINAVGYEGGNAWFTSIADIPWLQDADTNGDSQSDVWAEWQVAYRDVVILDEENVPAGIFNLTTYNLQDGENYSTLRQMFISTATSADFDLDGNVDGSDFLMWQQGGSPNPLSAEDLADWEGLFGTTSILSSLATVPEPSSIMLLLAAFVCSLPRKRLT